MTEEALLALADEASISEIKYGCRRSKDETPESQSDSDASAVATAPEPAEMGRKGLLGRKVGMTQIFDDDGTVVPVTVIEAEPPAQCSFPVLRIEMATMPFRWVTEISPAV